MKLLRHGSAGNERPGILDGDGTIRDLSAIVDDFSPDVIENGLDRIAGVDPATLPVIDSSERLGPPVANVGKLVCIGLNYRKHARETGMEIPEEPVIFMKSTTSICGPNDNVILPKGATKVDWEVEYAIVIGKRALYISEDQALDHIAGYCVLNDVSERSFQIDREGQWVKGKSADTFAPMGPWLVTRDEIPDPHGLKLWLDVNGHRYQDSSTRDNIFSVPYMVSYLSQFMTLMPGDVITTGTPEGTGIGQKPPIYLKAGDVMRLGVEGLGEQCQKVISYEESR